MGSFVFSSLITVLAPLFIFNFTSLFMLSQENYGKFHSVKFLGQVFSSGIIFSTIIIPVLFIVFTVIDVIPDIYSKLYSVVGIMYGIATSCFLIFRLRNLLNPIFVAKRILASQKENEFYYYKTAQIPVGESVFDDLLELICGTINNNAIFESRKLFDYIFGWFALNIDDIEPDSKLFYDRKRNRFNHFFYTIAETLIQKDNDIIESHYIESISNTFLTDIDFEDFYKIDFPLASLKKLAASSIERGTNHDNQIASSIFYSIINPFNDILSKIENSENKHGFYIEESNQFRNFKDIILNNLIELYDCAIKAENTDFIKQTTLVRRFFNSHSGNDFIKWNNNYLKCYQEISYTYKKILECKNYDKKCAQYVLSEFKYFASNISYQDTNRTVIKHLFNTFIKDLYTTFVKLIDNTDYLRSYDFEVFYERTWNFDKCDDYQIDQYLNVFYVLIEKYFNKYKCSQVFESFETKDLWMRIEQIEAIWNERNSFNKHYCNVWKENVEKLKTEYFQLYKEYQKYSEALKRETKELKKVIKNEKYVD